MGKDRSLPRNLSFWLGLASGVLLLLLASIWLSRSAIARIVLAQFCTSRELICHASIEQLSFTSVAANSIQIGTPAEPAALSIESSNASIAWRGWQPRITKLTIESPEVSLGFDGANLDLRGLERLLQDGGGDTSSPDITVTNGQLILLTPAGTLTGNFEVAGSWPKRISAQFSIMPASIETLEAKLDLDSAEFDIAASAAAVTGSAALKINMLEMGPSRIEALNLRLDQSEVPEAALNWFLSAERLAVAAQEVLSFEAIGRMKPNLSAASDSAIWQRVLPIQGSGRSGRLTTDNGQVEETAFIFDIAAPSEAGISISAELAMLDIETPQGAAGDLVWIYAGDADPTIGRSSGSGELILTEASVAHDFTEPASRFIGRSSPVAGHGQNFLAQIRAAAQGFSTRVKYKLDTDRFGDWQFWVDETIAIQSGSGLIATLEPGLSGPVVSATADSVTFSGLGSIRTPSGLHSTADIRAIDIDSDRLTVDIGGFEVSPWTVNGTSLSARLNRARIDRAGSSLTTQLLGEIGFTGNAYGWQFRNAKLFGGVDARSSQTGWRLQMLASDCLGLTFGSAIGPSTLNIGPLSTATCPEAGRLAERQEGITAGKLNFGDLRIPFSAERVNGTAVLPNTSIEWRASTSLALAVNTDRADIDMRIAGRSLAIQTSAPRFDVDLAESTRFEANLGATALSGELIPADVAIPTISFNGTLRDRQFAGDIAAANAIVSDWRSDPLFEPVRADLVVKLENADMTGSANLFLRDDAFPIGEADFNVDLITLTGQAALESHPLVFTPLGLQPTQLSERLRGLLTNASGNLQADALIKLDQGSLSGTGTFTVTDLGFDTLRVGRVGGVNGDLYFDDLLSLTTPPDQTVTIGKIEPGLTLKDGDVRFQLRDNGEARLERASWPFAGGTLIVQPMTWTIAGQSDTVVVAADEIELEGLIQELQLPDLEAKGTLSGTLPIVFESGNVLIQDAKLIADESGGFLRYTGQSVSSVETQDIRVNSAFDALRDFRFSVLELGISGNLIGDLLLRLKLLGYNPDVLGGSEFSFNISIDSRFIDLVQSGRRALSTEWLARATASDPLAPGSDATE